MKRIYKISLKSLGATTLGLLVLSPTYAESIFHQLPEILSSLANAPVIADTVLDNMHGRFVSNGVVQYFGLEMISTWQNPTATLKAGIGFSANLSNKNNPQFDYRPFSEVNDSATNNNPTNAQITGSDGLDQVNGVVQSIQVAGFNNQLKNNVDIQMIPNDSGQTPTFSGPFSNIATQPFGSSQITKGANGSYAMTTANANQITTQLFIPGQGQVIQSIRQSNPGLGSGIFQNIGINSDDNSVQNTLKLKIQMDTNAAQQQMSQQQMQILKTLGKL